MIFEHFCIFDAIDIFIFLSAVKIFPPMICQTAKNGKSFRNPSWMQLHLNVGHFYIFDVRLCVLNRSRYTSTKFGDDSSHSLVLNLQQVFVTQDSGSGHFEKWA